jgi:serine/threonine protein kinase
VGTPAYIAPEVLSRREYDGKVSHLSLCSSLSLVTLQLGPLVHVASAVLVHVVAWRSLPEAVYQRAT